MSGDIQTIEAEMTVSEALAGSRLDQIAAQLFPEYSRSRIQQWIKQGDLRVNGERKKSKEKLFGGELLTLNAELAAEGEWNPEPLALDITYEDDTLLVINKPAGLVVHPAAGNRQGTLLNGLLSHHPQLENVPRAGIVHRLDKDTTGLMVVAKTLAAHHSLIKQLQARTVSREYQAVCYGVMTGGGTVEADIGRHPKARTKMAVVGKGGKPAITHYRVMQRYRDFSHIRVKLETGRTHQIRVHMAHIGYPLVGDSVYAGRLKIPKAASESLVEMLRGFPRQALHAAELGLIHPDTEDYMCWQAPLPADFETLLSVLQRENLA
ncbi:MAG: 23S rRNA pseudouridine(1911/1915/1917) synthase RluD [Porticoccaceae bacterium]|nr:23S rRNA pseudouridine(1911/1915/1917) synthase RluD [Pseudomonadales bacterium]MCP5172498.1 23S rRNA pseudouridine(1911/1915/1917) synthase RluD [Pseudomonadales bacterium]